MESKVDKKRFPYGSAWPGISLIVLGVWSFVAGRAFENADPLVLFGESPLSL